MMARGFETLRHDILSLGTTTSQTIDIPILRFQHKKVATYIKFVASDSTVATSFLCLYSQDEIEFGQLTLGAQGSIGGPIFSLSLFLKTPKPR